MYSFSNSNLNFVGQIFNIDGKLKFWEYIKHQFSPNNNIQCQYLQIIDALSQNWKKSINQFAEFVTKALHFNGISTTDYWQIPTNLH